MQMESLVEALKSLPCREGEPGMWCTWSNVFFSTNEQGARTTLRALQDKPLQGNTIVGTSCSFNLDVLLSRLERARKNEEKLKIENVLIVRA